MPRYSLGSVSGSHSSVATNSSAPNPASTTKIPGHAVQRSTCPPMIGASIGPRPLTSINAEKKRAIAAPENRSRTAALAITTPAEAATPCANRSTTRGYTEGAMAQASELST
ncbi:hypothetical protein Aglo01_51220 [Actinokineospora globicatena]|nr:hypothetical protein Aglo01_51220 [Actinokineospora globicatena]GLW87468.1 hypothetical protein Aglo02_51070 [Actinokineospora globicatena]